MDKNELLKKLEGLKEDYKKRRENTFCWSREMDDCDKCWADHILEAKLEVLDEVLSILNSE